MNKTLEALENLLKKDERFVSQDGKIMRNSVYEASNKMDEKLLSLLLSDEKVKEVFFKKINEIYVFDKQKFNFVINNREMLPDSYTRYKQDIGLINSKDDYISATNDVVLSFPFKDCILEFDSTDTDQKRKEVFFNETLAHDEIDHLFSNKVLTNAKLIDKEGEKELTKFDVNSNLLIKGNNLLTMYSLLPRYKGQIKLMYWDILYNTESDQVPYADSFKHSSWLTMMKNRLDIAKNLLSDDGIICLQCDDNEMAYLKVLCDEIFGRDNKLSLVTVKVKAPAGVGQESYLFDVNEYILIYSIGKNPVTYAYKTEEPLNENVYKQYNLLISLSKECNKIKTLHSEKIGDIDLIKYDYYNIERVHSDNKNEEFYRNNINEIIRTTNPQGGLLKKLIPHIPKEGLYSITYKPTKGAKSNDYITYFFSNGSLIVWLKDSAVIKNNKILKLNKMTNLWIDNIFQGIAQEGKVELKAGKKPERLIERIIRLNTKEKDIVLDAYFGSGTTGAVAMKMGRKFIGIEQLDSHIELAKTRLKNVIAGDETGISKAVNWKGGGSFTYCELKRLNENYAEEIKRASTKEELCDTWKRMFDTGFISCFVDKDKVLKMIKDPNNTSIDDMKKVLVELLDKNQLYVNYEDMNDENFKVSDIDKKFTESFYNAK